MAFFITLGGPQAHDSSVRDDKFVWATGGCSARWVLKGICCNKFVISTGA
jgi:hypothetical protein